MILRKCKIEDALIIHEELGCRPEMLHYTGWNPYASLESTKEFLSNAAASESNYSWIIGARVMLPRLSDLHVSCLHLTKPSSALKHGARMQIQRL